MTQEYTVKSWQCWIDRETDEPIQDNHGNYKGSITFDEYNSEPVDGTFKKQPEVGDKKYGSVEEYSTKSGKKRLKFQRADRPQEGGNSSGGGSTYQPRDDASIKAQFAIREANSWVSLHGGGLADVEVTAAQFFDMIDRVKTGTNKAAENTPPGKSTSTPNYVDNDNNDEPLPEPPRGW